MGSEVLTNYREKPETDEEAGVRSVRKWGWL